MSHDDKPLKDQITEAMAAISRQLEILRVGPNLGGPDDNGALINELEAEYQELKQARANLGADWR
jgi:hypothetical protein